MFFSSPSFASASTSFVFPLHLLTFLVARLNRTSFHFLMSQTCRKNSCNWQGVNFDLSRYISAELVGFLMFIKAKLSNDAKCCVS